MTKSRKHRTLPRRAPARAGWARRFRLLRETRGTASTETIMMTPAFLIIWGAVFYVFMLGRNIIEMNTRLREGAWQRAYDGCQSTPASPTRVASASSGGGVDTSAPIFGSLLDLFFEEFRVSRSGSVSQPPILGSSSRSYRGDALWMCNEDLSDYDITNFISRLWSSISI